LIGEEITRLERIVRDFLQYARPAEPNLVAVAPLELFRYVLGLLEPQFKALKIEIVLGEITDSMIEADPQQLRQVLINLLQNSAESIGGGGRITMSARTGEPLADGRASIVLEVADTGKGIPTELHAHLFDPFFTDKPTGTGLGLPTAARVIARHGGVINFFSEVNRGTTFQVTLPAAKDA
jgi:signal transduction histidine kinase